MDRRTIGFFLVVLIAVAALGIGAAALGGNSAATRPNGPTVDGIVVGVDSAGLSSVSAFRLRTDDGRTLQFGLSSLGNPTEFPPGHLAEHLANSVRIRVWYRDDGGPLEALWIEDAPTT